MRRSDFLRSLTLSAAGLLIAPDALELIVGPRRRYWPGADFGMPIRLVPSRMYWIDDSGIWMQDAASDRPRLMSMPVTLNDGDIVLGPGIRSTYTWDQG